MLRPAASGAGRLQRHCCLVVAAMTTAVAALVPSAQDPQAVPDQRSLRTYEVYHLQPRHRWQRAPSPAAARGSGLQTGVQRSPPAMCAATPPRGTSWSSIQHVIEVISSMGASCAQIRCPSVASLLAGSARASAHAALTLARRPAEPWPGAMHPSRTLGPQR